MAVIHLTSENFNETINSGKTVLVDFWAPWCGPCKMVGPILDEVAQEVGDDIIIAKVNVDDETDLAQQFAVMSIPTMIAFKEGKETNKTVGLVQKDKILALLK